MLMNQRRDWTGPRPVAEIIGELAGGGDEDKLSLGRRVDRGAVSRINRCRRGSRARRLMKRAVPKGALSLLPRDMGSRRGFSDILRYW